jgi:MarR family transcriptional regulator, lower aerobic nicotinate degradation pathway regulator
VTEPGQPPTQAAGSATPGTLSPASEIGLLLRQAHRRAARAFTAALQPLGIDGKHVGVLIALARTGPGSQRELIERTGSDKSAMVRILDELERRGFARRKPAERDRRAHLVELTPQGRELLISAQQIADEVAGALLACLAPDEQAALRELLRRFATASESKEHAPGSPTLDVRHPGS